MTATSRPTIAFDHHSPEFARDQAERFAELRATCPVGFTEAHGGYWVASTYECARKVLDDDRNFTVERNSDGTGGKLIPGAPHAPKVYPGAFDGEEHDRLREPLRPLFTKKYMETKVAPVVRHVANALLDGLVNRDEFDFANEFSFKMAIGVTFGFAGVDIEDKEGLVLMLEQAFAINPEAGDKRDQLASENADSFGGAAVIVRELVRARAADPKDDAISAMISPESGLSEDDVVALTLSVAAAGIRVIGAALDNMAWHLDEDRELRRTLIEDPSLIPGAVDELLRVYSPTPLVARTAVNDVELGGMNIKAGDRIAALVASANLDEDRFPDAGDVKLGRRDGMHLVFGVGTHHCLGNLLAKMELTIALETILERMSEYEVVHEKTSRYTLVGVNNGFTTLTIRPRPAT